MSTTTEIIRAVRPGPVFLGLVAGATLGGFLLYDSTPGRSLVSISGTLLLVVGGWMISLALHEFGHAVTAFSFGDKNVELRGYLTLNPLRYTHPGLSIALPVVMILLGGIGFPGGAVYVNQHGFTRAQRTIVSLAGPLANIAIGAAILAFIPTSYTPTNLNLYSALGMLALLQITAALLNLLPIPGFDGYHAIEPYLSDQTRRNLAPIGQYGYLIVFVILLVPGLNRIFFDAVYWLFELSGVDSIIASYGYDLLVFWR
ncbi:site-2 protease family protein [Williamsia sp. CHRR-6]|uniref:site-2 protease family protein n=1 Tax=Williamsia sp. CHRR-6 TaxID=2835871 RepID=UPI001BDAA734|nr:site-2 protease family protein [Williamsia sp. CHRR-6]MBT0566185.1 site-2 protease family protein [Williamsia sp. CHRR-6]